MRRTRSWRFTMTRCATSVRRLIPVLPAIVPNLSATAIVLHVYYTEIKQYPWREIKEVNVQKLTRSRRLQHDRGQQARRPSGIAEEYGVHVLPSQRHRCRQPFQLFPGNDRHFVHIPISDRTIPIATIRMRDPRRTIHHSAVTTSASEESFSLSRTVNKSLLLRTWRSSE